MKQIPLGKTGIHVSEMALGTMYFGSTLDEVTSYSLLDTYLDMGGTFIDTANNYVHWVEPFVGGESERLLGRWMQDRRNRSQVFLATKIGFDIKGKGAGMKAWQVEQNIERCLQNLGTDVIDLLYIHCDDLDTPLTESLGALDKAVRQGKVRYLGASNFAAWRLAEALYVCEREGLAPLCCLQNRYTYFTPDTGYSTAPQVLLTPEHMDLCRAKDLLMLAFSPLLQGAYSLPPRPIPEGYDNPYNQRRREQLFDLAKETGVSPNQLVLAWMMGQGIIPMVTGDNQAQLLENLAASTLALDAAHLAQLG